MITNQATFTGKAGQSHYARTSLCDRSGEQALVSAAQAGMTEAMDELLLRHRTALYRAARRFTRSHEDAEDLVQDAMLRAFVNVRKFRKECQFATWLMAIVNNAALSMKRKGKNTFFVSLDSSARRASRPESLGYSRCSPQSRGGGHAAGTPRISPNSAFCGNHEHTRAMLERCVFDEVRIADAASSLGLTIGSAKSSLYRARRRVSESFERRGLVKQTQSPKHAGALTERLKNAEQL